MPGAAGSPATGGDFASAISSAMNQVETAQQTAQTATMDLLVRGQGDVHTVALATQHRRTFAGIVPAGEK